MDSELWRQEVQSAADRWDNGPAEIPLRKWQDAALAKAAAPGGIGSPEWRQAIRRAHRRAWLRHPLRSARAAARWQLLKALDHDS